MTEHAAMHALGVLSLLVIAAAGALSGATIITTVAPQWRRILRLAAGHVEPAPRAASGAPSLAPASSRSHAAEAGAEQLVEVR